MFRSKKKNKKKKIKNLVSFYDKQDEKHTGVFFEPMKDSREDVKKLPSSSSFYFPSVFLKSYQVTFKNIKSSKNIIIKHTNEICLLNLSKKTSPTTSSTPFS